jgi:hypothetical protein
MIDDDDDEILTHAGTTLRLGLLEYRRRRGGGGRGAQLLHVLEVRRRAGGAHGQDEAERRRVRGALHGRHGRLHCVHHAPRPLHPPRPRRRIPEVSEHAHTAAGATSCLQAARPDCLLLVFL